MFAIVFVGRYIPASIEIVYTFKVSGIQTDVQVFKYILSVQCAEAQYSVQNYGVVQKHSKSFLDSECLFIYLDFDIFFLKNFFFFSYFLLTIQTLPMKHPQNSRC